MSIRRGVMDWRAPLPQIVQMAYSLVRFGQKAVTRQDSTTAQRAPTFLAPANVPSGKQSASASLRAGFRKCLRRAYSLPISTIHHVGGRDRRNDLTGCHDRTRVVRDIDVEGSMHHLVRVVRRRVLDDGDVITELGCEANSRFDAGMRDEPNHD